MRVGGSQVRQKMEKVKMIMIENVNQVQPTDSCNVLVWLIVLLTHPPAVG